MKELKLKIQSDLTKKYYIKIIVNADKDLKAKAIWRGHHKTSKCLIVVPKITTL